MGRIEKLKRQLIKEANQRVLGEQEEKISIEDELTQEGYKEVDKTTLNLPDGVYNGNGGSDNIYITTPDPNPKQTGYVIVTRMIRGAWFDQEYVVVNNKWGPPGELHPHYVVKLFFNPAKAEKDTAFDQKQKPYAKELEVAKLDYELGWEEADKVRAKRSKDIKVKNLIQKLPPAKQGFQYVIQVKGKNIQAVGVWDPKKNIFFPNDTGKKLKMKKGKSIPDNTEIVKG